MDKCEYMRALTAALAGLPGEIIENTLWKYEKKFIDGKAAGRSETEISHSLEHPRLIAEKLRAAQQYQQIKRQLSVQSVSGLFITLIGIAVFNLFLIVPAICYFFVLCGAYICSLVFYGAGIVMLACGLAGVPQFSFEPGFSPTVVVVDDDTIQMENQQAFLRIDAEGIHVNDAQGNEPASGRHLTVANDLPSKSSVATGAGMLIGGIALLILCLLATRFTFVVFKRYVLWSISLLRAPFATVAVPA